MTGKIFSPGKLLLTSEYAVLDGALALAVPTKWGQEFFYEEKADGESLVFWEAYHQDKSWLKATINYASWTVVETNLPEAAAFILKTLQNVAQLADSKFKDDSSYRLKTNLQFPANFGLGSSSTLINNLAEWAEIDPFRLNELSLGGSGYDISVAREKTAVIYQNFNGTPNSERVVFKPNFKDELIFIHLNKKQDSREGIQLYRSKAKFPELISTLSAITREVATSDDIERFSELMEIHERKLSKFLTLKRAKEIYFTDCPVFVKSLGAWGGDFVMSRKFEGFETYFSELGFHDVFEWDEIID